MLLNDDEIQERLESPLNLLNRLKNATAPKTGIPSLPPPNSKDIGLDIEGKLAANQLRDKAASVMGKALQRLDTQINDVDNPGKLAQIAEQMNRVLNATNDKDKNPPAQIIVYAPQVIQENHFQELTLTEDQ